MRKNKHLYTTSETAYIVDLLTELQDDQLLKRFHVRAFRLLKNSGELTDECDRMLLDELIETAVEKLAFLDGQIHMAEHVLEHWNNVNNEKQTLSEPEFEAVSHK